MKEKENAAPKKLLQANINTTKPRKGASLDVTFLPPLTLFLWWCDDSPLMRTIISVWFCLSHGLSPPLSACISRAGRCSFFVFCGKAHYCLPFSFVSLSLYLSIRICLVLLFAHLHHAYFTLASGDVWISRRQERNMQDLFLGYPPAHTPPPGDRELVFKSPRGCICISAWDTIFEKHEQKKKIWPLRNAWIRDDL